MTIEYPSSSWRDYELIDSGNFENWSALVGMLMIRPEQRAFGSALFRKSGSNVHTKFAPVQAGKAGKEDSGSWSMLNKMDKSDDLYPGLDLIPS